MALGDTIRFQLIAGIVSIRGLAYDGKHILNLDGTSRDINWIDPNTFAVVRTVNVAGNTSIAVDGKYAWIINSTPAPDQILQVDLVTGAEVNVLPTPLAANNVGLTCDGKCLWLINIGTDRIYQIDRFTGALIYDIPAPGASGRGLTWDGKYLWYTETTGADTIHQVDPNTGAVINSVLSPGVANLWGITFDRKYLWINNATTLYQVSVD